MTIPEGFQPTLAINIDKVKQQPATRYASVKLDGIRCLFFGGVAYSRTLKPLPNKKLQALAKQYADVLESCDGEVIAGGDQYAAGVLQRSNSFCMKADNDDEFCVYLFDRYIPDAPWISRYWNICEHVVGVPNVKVLQHYFVREDGSYPAGCTSWVDLALFEQEVLAKGGEGCIVRDAFGKYKLGRSATKNPELQKVKRFDDAEFNVVGYEQFETNQNELERDERGYAKRSTSKQGKQLVEQLGSLVCSLPDGRTFNVGSGFTLQQRKDLWENRDTLVGKLAKVQYFGYSPDGIPLLPVFLDFRNEIDV